MEGSTGRQRLSASTLASLDIDLPSLPEQRAISHILQTIQNAIQARKKELQLEREHKLVLMQHLFTYGIRNEPTKQSKIGEIPKSWKMCKLEQVLLNAQYGISLAGSSKGEYPIFRMNNLMDGLVTYKDWQYVNLDDATFQIFKLNKGDVLFNRTNSADLVGKTSLFDTNIPAVFASYLIRLTTDGKQLSSKFLNWYFNWEPTQRRLRALASRGVSQSNISASKLQNFEIPIPDIAEQEKIAEVFNACMAKVTALEKEISLQEELFRTLLEELMTGRLSTLPLLDHHSSSLEIAKESMP